MLIYDTKNVELNIASAIKEKYKVRFDFGYDTEQPKMRNIENTDNYSKTRRVYFLGKFTIFILEEN